MTANPLLMTPLRQIPLNLNGNVDNGYNGHGCSTRLQNCITQHTAYYPGLAWLYLYAIGVRNCIILLRMPTCVALGSLPSEHTLPQNYLDILLAKFCYVVDTMW